MADPAPYRIQGALKALLEIERPTLTVEIDRSDEEPFADAEMPALSLRVVAFTINDGPEQYATGHDHYSMTLQGDCWSASANANSIDKENLLTIAAIIKVVTQNPSIGGLCISADYTGASGADQHGANTGCTIFELNLTFQTVKGDITQIVGANGLVIP
jgi:hypothetical protein